MRRLTGRVTGLIAWFVKHAPLTDPNTLAFPWGSRPMPSRPPRDPS